MCKAVCRIRLEVKHAHQLGFKRVKKVMRTIVHDRSGASKCHLYCASNNGFPRLVEDCVQLQGQQHECRRVFTCSNVHS